MRSCASRPIFRREGASSSFRFPDPKWWVEAANLTGISGTRALVTGVTGFIGSHVAHALVQAGATVHGFARSSASLHRIEDLKNRLEIHEGDIRDAGSLLRCVMDSQPEVIFHVAGDTSARRAEGGWDGIDRSIAVNLTGTLNVVRAAVESKVPVRRIIRAGGLEEYGMAPIPYLESGRERPVSAYSASQVATTHFFQALQPQLEVDLVTVRPALAYGPFQDTSFFIPQLIESCLSGKDFEMTNGKQKRDFVHIDDVARGLLLAATASGLRGEVINLASGEECSLNAVADRILRLTGAPINIKRNARRASHSDLEHLEGSTEHALALLGWKSMMSLDDGLARTVEWHRSHREALPAHGAASTN